jgi:hypothetical protein
MEPEGSLPHSQELSKYYSAFSLWHRRKLQGSLSTGDHASGRDLKSGPAECEKAKIYPVTKFPKSFQIVFQNLDINFSIL